MFCPRCHRRFDDDHRFCPHDGDKLVDALDIRRIRSQPTEHVGMVVAERWETWYWMCWVRRGLSSW